MASKINENFLKIQNRLRTIPVASRSGFLGRRPEVERYSAIVTAVAAGAPPQMHTIRFGHWETPSSSSKGTWVDDSEGVDDFAYAEDPTTPACFVGQYVTVYLRGWDDSTPEVPFFTIIGSSGGGGGLIPVNLTSDGGTHGDKTTASTYTYGSFINAITGAEITMADGSSASGQSPAWARPVGWFDAATHGTVYVNSSGDPVLWQVDEAEEGCD